jgi:hypothetical protein
VREKVLIRDRPDLAFLGHRCRVPKAVGRVLIEGKPRGVGEVVVRTASLKTGILPIIAINKPE